MGWMSHTWLVTSILSAVFFAIASFIVTIGAKKNYSISQMLLGLYISGAIMFAGYVLLHNGFFWNKEILLWGLIIGLGSSLGNALFTYSLKLGPVSLTAPLANSNVILVIAMSVFYYGESISVTQIIAITLILLACFLLPFDPDEKKNVKHNSWFVVILFTIFFMFLLNGGLKITQELSLDNTLVLFYSYIFSIIFFLTSIKFIQIKFHPKFKSSTTVNFEWQKRAIQIGLFAGLFSFLGLQMYTMALAIGPASVVVPIFSARNVVVAMLCLWYFKESLSIFQKVALTSLLSGLVLVGI